MRDILVVVPSLRRANNAKVFIDQWKAMASGLSDLLFVLEDNDDTVYPKGAKYLIGEYRNLGNAFNAAYTKYPKYTAYAPWNDDHLVRTQGWEEMVLATLAARGGIVYGDDGFQGEKLATAPVIDGELVRALGYISPPGLPHLYIDDAWMALGRALGALTYLPDLLVEHMHPEAGKAAWDKTYREANSQANYQRDSLAFQYWAAEGLGIDVERARAALDG